MQEKNSMFNMSMTGNHCLSPRVKQLTQLSRPFFQGYNMTSSDCRTPRTPKDLPQHPFWNPETLQFAKTPRHINSYEASSTTPKYRRPAHQFYDSEMTQVTHRPSRLIQGSGMSFEAYSQQFFSQYRFSTTPRTTTTEATTTTTTIIAIAKEEDEEEDEEILLGFIERLNKVDIESSEFLSMFPKPEEAIQLVEYLRARVQDDPEVRSIWDLLEQLPANLRDQVDMEGIGFSMAKHRSLYVHSKSSKKLERFKVRTLDLGGVVVKEGGGTSQMRL